MHRGESVNGWVGHPFVGAGALYDHGLLRYRLSTRGYVSPGRQSIHIHGHGKEKFAAIAKSSLPLRKKLTKI